MGSLLASLQTRRIIMSLSLSPSLFFFSLSHTHIHCSVSDRRGSGKPRPKSEGFELYNNSAQNGSPESPQLPWTECNEPKKLPGDDRLLKNRADHRSSPNVASKQAPAYNCFCELTSEISLNIGIYITNYHIN